MELRLRARNSATPFSLYADALKYWWWPKQKYAEHMPIEMFRDWCRFLGTYRLTPKNIGREYITQTRQDGRLTVDLGALDETVKPLNDAYFAPYSFNLHRLPSAAGMDKTAAGQMPP